MIFALPAAVVPILLPLLAIARPALFGQNLSAAIWGVGLLLCFGGWGGWFHRRVAPRVDLDLGLRLAWGLAASVVVGGLLCLVSLARAPVLLGWTFAGIALAARDLSALMLRSRHTWRSALGRLGRPEALLVAALAAVAAVLYLGAALPGTPNPSDDWPAYLPFVNMIPQSGTLVDPFSVRRMAAYGGQSYLQALVGFGANESQISLFDRGVCLVLLLALLSGHRRQAPDSSRLLLVLGAAAVLALPEVKINSASQMSGAVGFLAVYRTLILVQREGLPPRTAAITVGMTAAAVGTLRQNYLLVLAILLLGGLLAAERTTWPERWRRLVLTALATGLFILPWALLALRSNGTFLFPIFPGNFDRTYPALTVTASWADRIRVYSSALLHNEPVHSILLFLLAAPALARGHHRGPLLGLWLGTVVGFAFLAMSLPEADNFTIARYGFASIVAFTFATTLAAAEAGLSRQGSMADVVAVGLVLIALAAQLQDTRANAVRSVFAADVRKVDPNKPPLDAAKQDVRRMQQATPAGEKLLVMVERPYLLDYGRNRIEHLDLPGAASPPPGIPLQQGADAVAAYLLRRGTRYFAFALPDKAEIDLYSRAHWRKQLNGRAHVWRVTAPVFLSTFDVLDGLAKGRRRLYDDGHLVMVDLALPPA